MPPSTGIVAPVINPARSDARNAAMSAISDSRASRPTGMRSTIRRLASSVSADRVIGVSTTAGASALAVIPNGPQFARQSHGQCNNAGFGGAIKRVADRAAAAHGRHRCDVDDAAKTLLSHSRDSGFHAMDDAGQIDLRDPLPFGDGQISDEAGREHAGGIDENVDTAKIGNGFYENPFYGGRDRRHRPRPVGR